MTEILAPWERPASMLWRSPALDLWATGCVSWEGDSDPHTKLNRKHLTHVQSSLYRYLVLKVSHLKWENEHLYVEGDTERIHYGVTDGNRFTKTLIVSRQVFKHTWEYITDTLQEYTDTLLFPKHAEKHFIFTIRKKTVLQWHPNLLILPSGQKLNFCEFWALLVKGEYFWQKFTKIKSFFCYHFNVMWLISNLLNLPLNNIHLCI